MFETSPISIRQDDERQAFVRYLPKRVEAFEQRIRRYLKSGWDNVGMIVLRGDVQRLAENSGRFELTETREHLRKLAQRVGDHCSRNVSPDPEQYARMLELLAAVTDSLTRVPEPRPRPKLVEAKPAPVAPVEAAAPAPEPVDPNAASEPAAGTPGVVSLKPVVVPAPPEPEPSIEATEPVIPPGAVVPAEPPDLLEQDESVESDDGGLRRAYLLHDGNAFATELAARLESKGYAVESLSTFDELSELVMCLLPHVLLVDASRLSDLGRCSELRRQALQSSRTHRQIRLVALADRADMDVRRSAHRAGVDLLLFAPFDVDDTVSRLQGVRASSREEKVKVLIVEDSRADAFYAQTVLNNAGMQAHVEHDATRVLESLEILHPDLVLMDLHMPFANGVEVTLLIRDHPVFARLPVVFLSGESDPDSRLEAANAGGDDFLFKPIRPRHLVEVVRERVRRMHPAARR